MFNETEDKCNLVVNEICSNMDAVVNTLSQYKNPQSINNLTDEQMYSAILEIGLVVYNMQVRLETIGIKSDVAKILLEYRQSEVKANMSGKISDKESAAILNSTMEQENAVIYNRAYRSIKGKIDVAMELINSLKKIVSDRIENKKLAYGKEYK
jgi:hypothetical protein